MWELKDVAGGTDFPNKCINNEAQPIINVNWKFFRFPKLDRAVVITFWLINIQIYEQIYLEII